MSGKVAVITGGASGIGAGTAETMRAEGGEVCVTDISASDDPASDVLHHDVSSRSDWQRVHDHVLERYGRVDALVNCAGIFAEGMVKDVTVETWDRIVAVNQTGTLLGMQAFAKALGQDGGGAIINLSSYAGMQGHGTSVAYQATKWAIRGMTRFAARELATSNVRVNAIVPGFIDTPMVQSATQQLRDSAVHRTPLGRLGGIDEVARAIVYLASDESSFITGTEIVIDGGLIA